MVNKKIAIIVIILLIIGGSVLLFGDTIQLAFSGTVYLPEYGSLWCGPCLSGIDQESLSFDGTGDFEFVSDCGIRDADETGDEFDLLGYIPNGCSYSVSVPGLVGETWYAICNKEVSESVVLSGLDSNLGLGDPFQSMEGCTIGELQNDETKFLSVDYKSRIMLKTEPQTNFQWESQPFCLFTDLRGEFRQKKSCDRRLLTTELKDWPSGLSPIITAGAENSIQNVVIGYSSVVNSVDVVKSPTTGKNVYIKYGLSNNIVACPLKVGEDNKLFANINNCYRDDIFVCVPSILGTDKCIDGVELQVGGEGEDCTIDGLIGYILEGDQKCEKNCVNSKIQIGECVDIVDPTVPPDDDRDDDEESFLIPVLIGLGILIVVITLVLALRRRGSTVF